MAEEATLVLVEDIISTDHLQAEAAKLGGYLEMRDATEQTALFHFPTKGAAHDFVFVAQQKGHQAHIERKLFDIQFNPLEALREDAERIRRQLKKPLLRPPWAQ